MRLDILKPFDSGLREKLKYLGVWLDKSLFFGKHIKKIAGKTERLTTALNQIMPRKGGARGGK